MLEFCRDRRSVRVGRWSSFVCQICHQKKKTLEKIFNLIQQVERSVDGTSTLILRNIGHCLSGEVKCTVQNRQNQQVFNEVYANLTVLPQLNDYSECNHTYFGLFSGVNSVIEDQSVYITKKPDDIKTTVGETIRIEVRCRDVCCERSSVVSSECVNSVF